MRLKRANTVACVCALASIVVLAGAALSAAPALALPEGRHYEMVSPLYKGGYGVNSIQAVAMQGAAEGERVAFQSVGAFAGVLNNELLNGYLARRGPSEWSTESFVAPASITPYAQFGDIQPTFETALFAGKPAVNDGIGEEGAEDALLLHPLTAPGAGFEVAGILKRLDGKQMLRVGPLGASSNFCYLVVSPGLGSTEVSSEALLPEAEGTYSNLYELATGAPGCGGARTLRLLAASNELGPNKEPKPLDPYCLPGLGTGEGENQNAFNAISADGSEVFFTDHANLAKPECDGVDGLVKGPGDPTILYARLGGERTLQISKPIAADCVAAEPSAPCHSAAQTPAIFDGANEAGTRVFFTTTQPLVTDDADSGNDVYMASIGCPAAQPACEPAKREVTALTQISHDPNGDEAADVQNVSVIAPNGARAYFVAHGVLSGTNAEGHAPSQGADNLYVYDAEDGTTRFIADLCSGPETSGEAQDPRCPSNLQIGSETGSRNDISLWLNNVREIQTAGQDGRFLVFSSYAQLTPGDSDTTRDVYRYDAVSGTLDRVSLGEGGFDSNGNSDAFSAEIPHLFSSGRLFESDDLGNRAISEDGSRILFETAEPLSPKAVNGLVNAYEWHKEAGWSEGRVSLVSSGADQEPVGASSGQSDNIVITPSGRDIFFTTVQGLLPQDTDGASDIYDARLGEDFPPVFASTRPCSGDACQGPLTNPAPLLVPGSFSQVSGENLAPPAKVVAKNVKKKTKQERKRKKVRRALRGSVRGKKSDRGRGRR